jgi:exopolysaccharide/PEP-CTERM locus tyrosine autokinase
LIEPSPEITATIQPLKSIEIDFDLLRNFGYLPPPEQEREISEQYRHIKRPLLARALGRGTPRQDNGTVIMVTSALAGEGKTFSAINLALSLSLETDATVLLVDADTAKPQVSKAFGLQNEPGLVDALLDESCDVESLVMLTNVPKLAILPAGQTAESAAELLASDRMGTVLRRLTALSPNRIVLLDCPPLLITNEAKAIVDAVGQAVLVVQANQTPQQAVIDAIGHFREDQFVGLVLNQSETVAGYGYGYGYYGRMYEYGQPGNGRGGR